MKCKQQHSARGPILAQCLNPGGFIATGPLRSERGKHCRGQGSGCVWVDECASIVGTVQWWRSNTCCCCFDSVIFLHHHGLHPRVDFAAGRKVSQQLLRKVDGAGAGKRFVAVAVFIPVIDR